MYNTFLLPTLFILSIYIPQILYGAADDGVLIGKVLLNPSLVLKQNTDERNACLTSIDNQLSKIDPQLLNTIQVTINSTIQAYEQKNPIFLLRECIDPCCSVTRTTHPQYRDEFESFAVTEILKQCNRSDKNQLRYVSFGSGKLLQDLVLISKLLIKKPCVSITICLIDTLYEDYAKARADNNLSSLIEPEKKFDIQQIKKTELINKKKSLIFHAAYNQFTTFLKNNFSETNINIYVYDSVRSYIQNFLPADSVHCIQAADCAIKNFPTKSTTNKDFHDLCQYTLAKDNKASIITLTTEDCENTNIVRIQKNVPHSNIQFKKHKKWLVHA